MSSRDVRLSPQPIKITDHVGDTHSVTLTVTGEDLTAWTVTAGVYTNKGGTLLVAYTVSAGATRTLSLTAAQTATIGAGTHWYEIRTVDPAASSQTVAHGVFELEN